MELKYKAIACFLIGIFSLSGCTSTFDDLNTNPDTTTKVNASMLASKVILDMTKSASTGEMNFWSNGCFGENKSTIDNITVLEKAVLITSKL